MTKSYQISKDMDIETMPHAMYFTGNSNTITKINQVPYQTIQYNENGMFTTKLMNDTPIEIHRQWCYTFHFTTTHLQISHFTHIPQNRKQHSHTHGRRYDHITFLA